MSLRASALQRAKQSPLKRVILFDESQPLNWRLLRQRTARNDMQRLVAQPEGLPRHEAGLQPAEMDKKITRLNSNKPEEESVNKENYASEISLL